MSSSIKKYFIVAGEPSGDLHGSKLIKSIKTLDSKASFMGHGGNLMKNEGMKILEHIDNLSIMGFFEVLKHLPRMYIIMKRTINIIKKSKPDKIILIDYPGFNLRLAKKINYLNIPITYFILPQAWAWKKNRTKILNNIIDKNISIFPFEKTWYENNGVAVNYLGHPLAETTHVDESTKSFIDRHALDIKKPIIGLFPGSRQQEIDRHLPIYIKTVELLREKKPEIQVLLGKSPNIKLPQLPNYYCIESNSRKAMIISNVAIVCSGTASLECAVEETPMVVCYKLSFFSWQLAKILVKVDFSSIVNIMENKQVVPECIQHNMTPKNIISELLPLLDKNSNKREKMILDFALLKESLGTPGVYNRIAELIINN